jgi:hypothetical protein
MNTKLKAKIIEKYGTQADFAQVIATDESIISRVVRGRRGLDANIQAQWAEVLNCKVEDIFGRKGM